jgi:sec-independent protein translocase protein TatA
MLPITLALLDGPDVLLVVGIFVLLFGATKIPEIARSLGRAKGEFEKGQRESAAELARSAAAGPAGAAPVEDEKVLKAARELGIPTDGRSIGDIKADLKKRLA